MIDSSTPTGDTSTVVDARGLLKRYANLIAVNEVTFSVRRGEIFGLLGPNGAGKTTTLEMLEGLRIPDGGSASVLGEDIVVGARRIKARIGVQLQATALPALTKVREAIDLFASFYTTSRAPAELLAQFDLSEKADVLTTKLSGGQLQRLSLALAVINRPELIFLDEPTTGLDPQARLNMWSIIEGLRSSGCTVILTTHYMEEAERLCDRIAVIDGGHLVALDTPPALIAVHAPGTTIEFDTPPDIDQSVLRSLEGVDRVEINGKVRLHTTSVEKVLRALLDPQATWMTSGSSMVRDLRVHQGTLEDVFLNLTGRTLRS